MGTSLPRGAGRSYCNNCVSVPIRVPAPWALTSLQRRRRHLSGVASRSCISERLGAQLEEPVLTIPKHSFADVDVVTRHTLHTRPRHLEGADILETEDSNGLSTQPMAAL